MKKLNSGGFVLVETLIVAAFIMAIFAILYNNFYPLIGEYEAREVYDDIDGKYAAFWIKRVIQHDSVEFTSSQMTTLENDKYFQFKCSVIDDASRRTTCEKLIEKYEVMGGNSNPHIYVTDYYLGDSENEDGTVNYGFKEIVRRSDSFSGGLKKYLAHLPEYTIPSLNNAYYRIIVEFERKKDDNDYLAYATIEVKKE